MKLLAIVILLLCQLTTVNGQQTGCRIPVTLLSLDFALSSTQTAQSSQPIAQGEKDTVVSSPLSVDYYINQINLADSLYKNYLPQYNYDEVKAAVEFFDSVQSSAVSRQRGGLFNKKATDGNKLIAESRLLTAAKAHYYHAVGLTEREDVVGACEHYLKALEIMLEDETLVKTHGRASKGKSLKTKGRKAQGSQLLAQGTEEYEKTRFIYLAHTRLGELFLREACYNLSLINYKEALYYSNIIGNNLSEARTLKCIGQLHQILNNPDSALYYYKESLSTSDNIENKFDIEKCIAQILFFNYNEKDSAYIILKENLNKITNVDVKYSYHFTLGNMLYVDKQYDSALYYLEKTIDKNIIKTKLAFTTKLSAIYDSLGNQEQSSYYDKLSSNAFVDNTNKESAKAKLHELHELHVKNLSEKQRTEIIAKERKFTILISLCVFVAIVLLLILIWRKYKIKSNELKNEIVNYTQEIQNKNSIISQKEELIDNYQKNNDRKDKIISKQKNEINKIKIKIKDQGVSNIEGFYSSEICKNIIERKDNDFSFLKEDELALLLKSADEHLNKISDRLHKSFPDLNKNDMYTICLIILNVEKSKLPYLLNRDRKTVWDRLNKIRRLMGLDAKHDLFLFLKDNYLI